MEKQYSGKMPVPQKISYVFMAVMFLLVGMLHLSTPLITLLFSYFALRKLQFKKTWSKGFAVALFLILVVICGYGFYYFSRQAYVVLPKIIATIIPIVLEHAWKQGVELPFSDYASFKELIMQTLTGKAAGVGKYAQAAVFEVVAFIIGLVSAVSLFVDARADMDQSPAARDSLYSHVWNEMAERFRAFYNSFATVMGAQIVISAINTTLTAVFLLWNGFPHAGVIIVLTFLCGLLPIIGNLISNTLILGVAFTITPNLALWALAFLVILHKLEYFLNSKIIGHRIRNPMWLTLLGLIIGEKMMGIPGMILAPVVLHYIKVEASKNKVYPLSEPAKI